MKACESKRMWFCIVTIIVPMLFVCSVGCKKRHKTRHAATTQYESTVNSTPQFDETPSWILGEWACQTPYGVMQLKITRDVIVEILPDGEVTTSPYHIQDNEIVADSKCPTYYELDMAGHRISPGYGYYFQKIY